MMFLCDVDAGQRVRLDAVDGEPSLVRRLTALGLTPGAEAKVVQATPGRTVLAVRGSRVALGVAVTRGISVTPLATGNGEP